jgi:hypothetical protein
VVWVTDCSRVAHWVLGTSATVTLQDGQFFLNSFSMAFNWICPGIWTSEDHSTVAFALPFESAIAESAMSRPAHS